MGGMVRVRGELHCSIMLKRVLWRHGRIASTTPDSKPVHYVDVGTGLGDCMLVAASVIPEGKLRGLAIDAHAESVSLLRKSLMINGLTGSHRNASTGQAVNIALSNKSAGKVQANLVDGKTKALITTSTLDFEYQHTSHDIDVLSVHVAGYEEAVLRGSEQLLRAGRIRCVVSLTTNHTVTNRAVLYLRSLGYSVCGRRHSYHGATLVPRVGGACEACCAEKDGTYCRKWRG